MVDEDNPVIAFTAEDRCDRCMAQAYHLCVHPEFGELMFCNHHMEPRGKRYQLMLDEGWEIISDTEGYEAILPAHVRV